MFLGVLTFGGYKAMPIILGPSVDVSTPTNFQQLESVETVEVRGTVARANLLLINGVQTAFTEHGIFSSKIAVYSGNNILSVEVGDKFGRRKITNITVSVK